MNESLAAPARTRVTDAHADGLVMDDKERTWTLPWSAIEEVVACRVPNGNALSIILAFDPGESVVLAGETEAIWPELVAMLQTGFAGIAPYSTWSRALAGSAPTILFTRDV